MILGNRNLSHYDSSMLGSKKLLIVAHDPSPNMCLLIEATLRGASHPDIAGVEVKHLPPLQATAEGQICRGNTENGSG